MQNSRRFLKATAVLLLAWALVIAPARVHAQGETVRETWQRVPDLFAAMNVTPGASVADVGAGAGFLTVRLSAAVGRAGKVFAVDIDPKVVGDLRTRVATEHLTNVDVLLGAGDDPRLPPATLDAAIFLNAYHEVEQPRAMLAHLRAALKPGGRIVVCDPAPDTPGLSRQAQMEDHVLDAALIIDDLRTAGFEIVSRQDGFATNFANMHFSLIVARVR